MAITGPPLNLQSGSHSGIKARQLWGSLLQQSGVAGAGDCLVKQRASAGQGVLVSAGGIFLKGTSSTVQGTYFEFNDADFDVPATAADGSLSRIDRVIFRIRDPDFQPGSPTSTFEWLPGAAGSGVPANPPPDSVSLARVLRAANDNIISTGEITDERIQAIGQGGIVICTSSSRPTSPRAGQGIYETDTTLVRFWNGSAWITNAPGARHRLHIYDSPAESIVNGQWVNMPFNTTVTDDDSGWDATNRRYTVQRTGHWMFSAQVRMNSGGAALQLGLTKNRTIAGTTGDPDKWLYHASLGIIARGTEQWDLTAGDQIYVPVYNGYTAALNTIGGEPSSYLDAWFMG